MEYCGTGKAIPHRGSFQVRSISGHLGHVSEGCRVFSKRNLISTSGRQPRATAIVYHVLVVSLTKMTQKVTLMPPVEACVRWSYGCWDHLNEAISFKLILIILPFSLLCIYLHHLSSVEAQTTCFLHLPLNLLMLLFQSLLLLHPHGSFHFPGFYSFSRLYTHMYTKYSSLRMYT